MVKAQQPVPPAVATFEASGTGGGYVTGTVHGQNGWGVDLGSAVVQAGTGFGGTRGLKVEVASPFSQARLTLGAPTPAQTVIFFDFQVKGMATVATQDAQREEFLDVDGALLGLFRTSGTATLAEVFVFNGDGSGGGAWLGTGQTVTVDAGSGAATQWLRLGLRQDIVRQTFDLYVGGSMKAADCGFVESPVSRAQNYILMSHTSGAVYLDDLYIQATNPLGTDTDKDGMTDADETSRGFNVNADDRDLDTDNDGLSNLWEYVYTQDPAGDPDGDGLSNSNEARYGTNPGKADSDGDGVNDNTEVSNGSNPTDAADGGLAPGNTRFAELKVGHGTASGALVGYTAKLYQIKPEGARLRYTLSSSAGTFQSASIRLDSTWEYRVKMMRTGHGVIPPPAGPFSYRFSAYWRKASGEEYDPLTLQGDKVVADPAHPALTAQGSVVLYPVNLMDVATGYTALNWGDGINRRPVPVMESDGAVWFHLKISTALVDGVPPAKWQWRLLGARIQQFADTPPTRTAVGAVSKLCGCLTGDVRTVMFRRDAKGMDDAGEVAAELLGPDGQVRKRLVLLDAPPVAQRGTRVARGGGGGGEMPQIVEGAHRGNGIPTRQANEVFWDFGKKPEPERKQPEAPRDISCECCDSTTTATTTRPPNTASPPKTSTASQPASAYSPDNIQFDAGRNAGGAMDYKGEAVAVHDFGTTLDLTASQTAVHFYLSEGLTKDTFGTGFKVDSQHFRMTIEPVSGGYAVKWFARTGSNPSTFAANPFRGLTATNPGGDLNHLQSADTTYDFTANPPTTVRSQLTVNYRKQPAASTGSPEIRTLTWTDTTPGQTAAVLRHHWTSRTRNETGVVTETVTTKIGSPPANPLNAPAAPLALHRVEELAAHGAGQMLLMSISDIVDATTARTTRYEYDEAGRLKRMVYPGGYYQVYDYAEDGVLLATRSPVLLYSGGNVIPGAERRTAFDGAATPFTVREYLDAAGVSTQIGQRTINISADLYETKERIAPAKDGGFVETVTTSLTWPDTGGVASNQPKLHVRPDGTATSWSYGTTGTNNEITIVREQQGLANAQRDALSTVATTTFIRYRPSGTIEYVKTWAGDHATEPGAGALLLSSAAVPAGQYDFLDRPKRIDYHDGTYETEAYGCCASDLSRRSRSGTWSKDRYRDALGRLVLWSTSQDQAESVGTVIYRVEFDLAGRSIKRRHGLSEAGLIVTSESGYNSAGERIWSRDEFGQQTDYSLSFDTAALTMTATTLHPASSFGLLPAVRPAEIVTAYCDGSFVSEKRRFANTALSGTVDAVVSAHTCSLSGATLVCTDTRYPGGGAAAESVSSLYQWGTLVGRQQPYGAGVAESLFYYDAAGDLWKTTDPDGIKHLSFTTRAADANGVKVTAASGLDLNGDNQLTAAADRFRRTESYVTTRTHNATAVTVQRTVSQFLAGGVTTTVSTSDASVTGRWQWTTDEHGNTAWSEDTSLNGAGVAGYTEPPLGAYTVTTIHTDGTRSVTGYERWRPVWTKNQNSVPGTIGWAATQYDAWGRVSGTLRARFGLTTYIYADAAAPGTSRVVSTIEPDPAHLCTAAQTAEPPSGTWTATTGNAVRTATSSYDNLGRVWRTAHYSGAALQSATDYDYYPSGELRCQVGGLTYPQAFDYDQLGRMTKLYTWRSAGDVLGDYDSNHRDIPGTEITVWAYNPQGRMYNKGYPGEATSLSYAYTPAGRLSYKGALRHETAYHYEAGTGQLQYIRYSVASGTQPRTPDLKFTWNANGQLATVTEGTLNGSTFTPDAGGLVHTYAYGPANATNAGVGDLAYETIVGLTANTVTRRQTYEGPGIHFTPGRTTGYEFYLDSTSLDYSAAYIYDNAGRLMTLTDQHRRQETGASGLQTDTWSYSYATLAPGLLQQTTGPHHKAVRAYENGRPGLTGVTNSKLDNSALSAYGYAMNGLGQRTDLIRSGAAGLFEQSHFDRVTYNPKGEVTATARYAGTDPNNTGTPVTGHARGWSFDSIGNRLSETLNTITSSYTANDLNQLLVWTPPGTAPQETYNYDGDGNFSGGDGFSYLWDAENRLTERRPVSGLVAGQSLMTRHRYDYRGRRVEFKLYKYLGGPAANESSWSLWLTEKFLYHGWNPVITLTEKAGGSTGTLRRYYTWGPDVSGTAQGAGGVGGLLKISGWSLVDARPGSDRRFHCLYDGNGNLTELLTNDTAGQGLRVASHYEYDAFGRRTRSVCPAAIEPIAWSNPFRFSTKYQDPVTAADLPESTPSSGTFTEASARLYYYGYRFYSPRFGRWMGRDPIGEGASVPLFVFVQNNSISFIDFLGREAQGIDVGVYDPVPADAPMTQANKSEQEQMESHAKLYQNPIPAKNSQEMLDAIAKLLGTKPNCCISTLNLQTHGYAGTGGIKFRQGTQGNKDDEPLMTAAHGANLGKLLKPFMCNPSCQINLRGCSGLIDGKANEEKTGLEFAKALAKETGCSVMGTQGSINRIGTTPKDSFGGGGQPRWWNDENRPIMEVKPDGSLIDTEKKSGVGRWPGLPVPSSK